MQGQEAIDLIKRETKGWREPYQSAIDWTPDGSACYIDEMRYWVPIPWENQFSGRVTLAGDAAHSMLPCTCTSVSRRFELTAEDEDRGQGLQHSITDASNYVDALLKIGGSTDRALREEVMLAFDAEMVERGAKAVTQSIQEAKNSLNPEKMDEMLFVKEGLARTA